MFRRCLRISAVAVCYRVSPFLHLGQKTNSFFLLYSFFAPTQVDVAALWLSVSTTIIAFAFIFGDMMRQTFASIVLLFFVHPFDVGDWIVTDATGWARVDSLEINTCTFTSLVSFNCMG